MTVLKVLAVLIGLWILLGIVGFIIKGLFWLFVLACIAFGFTLAGSGLRRKLTSR